LRRHASPDEIDNAAYAARQEVDTMIEAIAIILLICVLLGVISFTTAAVFVGKLVIGGIILSLAIMAVAIFSSRG
jgi:hypothetical protein